MSGRGGRRRPELAAVESPPAAGPEPMPPPEAAGLHGFVVARLDDLRRHWVLALSVWVLVLGMAAAYAVLAVPTYASVGVVQVAGSTATRVHPLADLAGMGGEQVDTEVQVLQRRDFLLEVFKGLGLHAVDPLAAQWLSTDTHVTLDGERPTDARLIALREALVEAELAEGRFSPLTVELAAGDDSSLTLTVDPDGDASVHAVVVGEPLQLDPLRLHLGAAPLAAGESLRVELVPDGALLERLVPRLSVASLGKVRERTNLVQISFSSPDRYVAQAVVQGVMAHYVDQSLQWQSQGAAQAASFIRERLVEAERTLLGHEDGLRDFASG
ncbi:MAG: hypothetical protein K0V04_25895, partial [Deltaproteobacteria bacterium]|nr:hypothetical protein [Deltaproteobacteria bacterium]